MSEQRQEVDISLAERTPLYFTADLNILQQIWLEHSSMVLSIDAIPITYIAVFGQIWHALLKAITFCCKYQSYFVYNVINLNVLGTNKKYSGKDSLIYGIKYKKLFLSEHSLYLTDLHDSYQLFCEESVYHMYVHTRPLSGTCLRCHGNQCRQTHGTAWWQHQNASDRTPPGKDQGPSPLNKLHNKQWQPSAMFSLSSETVKWYDDIYGK